MKYLQMIGVTLICILVIALLSGCASIQPALDKAADANDTAVESAEFTICNGASIGSIRRAYGARPEVWSALCGDSYLPE